MPYPVPPPEPSAIIYIAIAKPKKAALTVAASDRDTRSNSAEIPESSPEILQSSQEQAQAEPSAALLGTTAATNQPPEITDPLTAVENGDAAVGFQRPVAVGKPETAKAEKDASFTAYQLGSVENAVAIRNRQRTVQTQKKEESWYQAKGQQLKDNAPEPAEITVPEPAPEPNPGGQQQFEIPTPGTAPQPYQPP